MATSYKGDRTKVWFSPGDGTLIDLTLDTGDISLAFTPNLEGVETLGTKHMGRVLTSRDVAATIGTLYLDDKADKVREAARSAALANNSTLLVEYEWGAYVGGVLPEGFGVTTPYNGLVSVSASLPASGQWYEGLISAEANLGVAFVNLPDKPADATYDEIWAVVDSAAAQTTTWTVADAGTNESDAISAKPGIYKVENLPSAPTRFKAAAAPSGTVKVRFLYGVVVGGE